MIQRALICTWLIAASFGLYGLHAETATAADEVQPLEEVAFTEGPTVDAEGNVYFTDMTSRRILKYKPGKGVTTFRENSNEANGMIFDDQWRLIACESGEKPRVTRTDLKTGEIEVLAESDSIKRPNDVTIDSKGRIYFTEVLGKSIYRIDPDGKITQIATAPEIQMPNGIVISADDKKLYMVESSPGPGNASLIRSYDLAENGTVSNMKVFYSFKGGRGADSISIDSKGNVYAAGGLNRTKGSSEPPLTKAGIYVISPEGKLVKFYPVWEDRVTNCAFGGPDMKTLYVTAGKSLLSVRVEIEGTRR